jgi:hypothetical protein
VSIQQMDYLFWIYLINSTILICHEIDSAFWQEWKLLNPKDNGGINAFLLLHIPMIFLILIGLVLVYDNRLAGYIISFIVAAGGLFAFFFHFYFIRKGRPEFNTPVSKGLIISAFAFSILQVLFTILEIVRS